jgi:hypothetical protein
MAISGEVAPGAHGERQADRIMVSYTTRHVYYAMPRCLGPSHPVAVYLSR